MSLTEFAPAKVNLFLHVGALRPDGRHPICSLAVFADVGDTVQAELAEEFSLTVDGPFADQVGPVSANLIARALDLAGAPPMAIRLTKQLPVASGLGGGTADGCAALRLALRLSPEIGVDRIESAARRLGADGLLCFRGETCIAQGEGEALSQAPRLPEIHAVLVNPGVASPTGEVYRAYDAGEGAFAADRPALPAAFQAAPDLAAFLASLRNDLEAPARRLAPEIGEVLEAVRRAPGVLLARMSGSGATVFGLWEDGATAGAAAHAIQSAHPDWWVVACRLGTPGKDA